MSRGKTTAVLALAPMLVLLLGYTPRTYVGAAALAEARKMAVAGSFGGALLTLGPLLAEERRSPDQEAAIWFAETLASRLGTSADLLDHFKSVRGLPPESGIGSGVDERAFIEWSFVSELRAVGADITWASMGSTYVYGHAFARRLLAEYPDTTHRPAAEFYAIAPGKNDPGEVHRWRRELLAYLDRHADERTVEVAAAHFTVGHIYDDLWDVLTEHGAEEFADPAAEDDADLRNRANEYRGQALRHYSAFLLTVTAGYPFGSFERVTKRMRGLRRRETDHTVIIFYD